MSTSSDPASESHISGIVTLIQELTEHGIRAESAADLFAGAFATLHDFLPFDVGVAVMLEQNLDLYLSTRDDAEALVNDQLVSRLRRTLDRMIPVSFAATDVVVRSERHDLARGEAPPSIAHELASIVTVERRTSGLIVLFRGGGDFTGANRQIAEIFSTQVSLLIANLNARDQILSLADTDDLTGIWNKRYFRRQLPQEMERARTYSVPLSLILFDVDDFKQINDNFGHTVGDVVLSELCGAVRETLRPPDVFVRFGGDEFAIVLPHTDLAGATAVADRILSQVRALSIPGDDEPIRCSISMGLAQFDRESESAANEFIRRADERLYDAKRSGKNRYCA